MNKKYQLLTAIFVASAIAGTIQAAQFVAPQQGLQLPPQPAFPPKPQAPQLIPGVVAAPQQVAPQIPAQATVTVDEAGNIINMQTGQVIGTSQVPQVPVPPEGFDPSQVQVGVGPQGFDPSQMQVGVAPQGFDPSQVQMP